MAVCTKILVIDDSAVARHAICEVVRATGFEPVELASPIGATREIIRNDIRIVIVDVNMPSMRGDKLAVLFRANPRFSGLRILFVSGESETEMQRLVEEAHADGYVSKLDVATQLPSVLMKLAGEAYKTTA